MIIYKITNLINNKIYIGQTTQPLEARWKQHCKHQKNNMQVVSAIKKYGKENFKIEIISRCSSLNEMNHREAYYIKLFNSLSPSGYNMSTGGSNSKHSKEVRKKISESKKGNKNSFFGKTHTEENRRKISDTHKGNKYALGKKLSEETKSKISISLKKNPPMLGKHLSEEAKKKLSMARKGKPGPNLGKPMSEEQKIKISLAKKGKPGTNLGKKFSDEFKQKVSLGLKKYHESLRKLNG